MAMPRETTPLIGKPGHARSLYDRAADWVVSYPATSVVLGVLGLLAATTAIVVPVEWSELETGTPPVCSKGGITAVLGPGTEAQRLFVFSGNTKHGQLLQNVCGEVLLSAGLFPFLLSLPLILVEWSVGDADNST